MKRWNRIMHHPNLPLGEGGKRVTACAEHISLSKMAAKEGLVLLKNQEKLLPLAKGSKLALFGMGTFDYVKGGGGSGDVTIEYEVNLYEGFKKLQDRVEICEDVADFYRGFLEEISGTEYIPGQKPEPVLPDELCAKARDFTDTAVISISRFSGEGWDRDLKGHPLYEEGDFYLSYAEKAMVNKVKSFFPKIIVVLNVGGMVDTEWFFADDQIQAVLMAWQGGMEGGSATAELLCGIGNPSGKLVDTFAKQLEDYPFTANFHDSDDYVEYTEDIYVGYRYFETLPGAADRVNYPFGFGLSYTEFAWSIEQVGQQGDQIALQVRVENVGSLPGKEVIQVYFNAPQGKLGKAMRSLIAFRKTALLAPGESQILNLEFAIDDMASYDDLGKIQKSAYVLEKGEYTFYVGNSVRNTQRCQYTYFVEEDRITQQLSAKIVPSQLKKRLLADGSYEELPTFEAQKITSSLPALTIEEFHAIEPEIRAVKKVYKKSEKNSHIIFFEDVAEGKAELDDFVKQLSDEQLIHLVCGQSNQGIANTKGFGNIPEYGVPCAMTADGPAGVRILKGLGIFTTAFPCVTQVACTWDPELAYAMGQAGAKEMKENNLAAWLTPAVNIHRSPLCGRNFEYYSEDPYLTGIMAGSYVRGIQSQKISASVKHFALNNKETNRKNSDSRISERAAREIYLKAFEMIVKTSDPWYVMSSYNLVNGVRASENRELLEDILRGEWGFQGIVSTDWHTYSEQYLEIKAGNDLRMPSGIPSRLQEALDKGLISREEIEVSAKRILQLILRFE